MPAFPNNFQPATWAGPRARQFSKRDDTFQQLVGDALREGLPAQIITVRTAGQDGSIDGYLPGSAALLPLFPLLAGPVIVECKDNDDSLPKAAANIAGAWSKVETKLTAQAAAGWPGLYAPWKDAQSYLYITSALITDVVKRQELARSVETFFRALRAKGQSKVQQVHVVDWSDVRDLLDRWPRLADAWLGVGLRKLRGHEEHVGALAADFRRYLLPANLPFVPPDPADVAHPDRLFERVVARAGKGGVLLTGAGGVGKTRTLLEVGERAHAQGWRVLHALHGEPALKDQELFETVVQGGGRMLVLCDYVDQMTVDFGSVKRQLFSEVSRRGGSLAFLASARTSRATLAGAGRAEFFESVDLQLDAAQAGRLVDEMCERLAPRAGAILGPARVRELAGARPIIALFILRELERRAGEGRLSEGDFRGVHAGDLIDWLRRRLREDELVVVPAASAWDEEDVAPRLIASAAVLVAAPQREEGLRNAALDAIHQAMGASTESSKDVRQAGRAVSVLRGLGWLEERDDELASAHDVVTDELVTQVLRERSGGLRAEVLESVLAPGKRSARTLGRLSIALRRLTGEAEGGFEADLAREARRWFDGAATVLGRLLTSANPIESSYAFGALFEGPPWAEAVTEQWGEIVEPWLLLHGTRPEARHLLFRGMQGSREAGARLVGPALGWLEKNGERADACFVLGPLLSRAELDNATSERAAALALSWLDIHGVTIAAGFVLHSLLGCGNLDGASGERAVAQALIWLDTHGGMVEVRFVLSSLLGRSDLDKASSVRAVSRAFTWLGMHCGAIEAQFVLRSLLDRSSLDKASCERAVVLALCWLDAHGTTAEAGFLLRSFLDRGGLDKASNERAVVLALSWLDAHQTTAEAGFVLHPLLDRSGLDNASSERAVALALTWLYVHGATIEAQFVLYSLLGCPGLDSANSERAVSLASIWLEVHGVTSEARFVLHPLLGRCDLDRTTCERAIALALSWLDAHGVTLEAQFVLHSLLGRRDLDKEGSARAVVLALRWLDAYRPNVEAAFVLSPLLERDDLNEGSSKRVAAAALYWLALCHAAIDASFVICRLLRRKDLICDVRVRAMTAALSWAEQSTDHEGFTFVIKSILRSPDAPQRTVASAVTLAQRWLTSTPPRHDRDFILNSLLQRHDIMDESALRGVAMDACHWVRIFKPRREAAMRLLRHLMPIALRAGIEEDVRALAVELGVALPSRLAAPSCRAVPPSAPSGLVEEIRARAQSPGGSPDLAFLRRALDTAWHDLSEGRVVEARLALPGLLSLAARTGDAALTRKAHTIASNLLRGMKLTSGQRTLLIADCYRLLDAGAWPDRADGERALTRLGLLRPP